MKSIKLLEDAQVTGHLGGVEKNCTPTSTALRHFSMLSSKATVSRNAGTKSFSED